ncbi:MAG TPA: NAD(P)/FAD-dependent oxidoreductase [Bryobacteraceae bacterium]
MEKTQVLIIGGGPAGATAATFLARAGVETIVIERDVFPRYHIGESLLPSCLEILDLMGARTKVEEFGFQKKPGAYLDWKGEQWSLDFGELRGRHQHSFQVERAEFDQILLQHARSEGAEVREGVSVEEICFFEERPVAAICVNRETQERTRIEFDYLIDASGRAGLMSTRYLRNRRFHETFKNVALWGYWEQTGQLAEAATGAIAVGSIPEGWLWAIPFSDGTVSVGVVMHKDAFKQQRHDLTTAQIYERAIANCPILKRITDPGKLVSDLRVEQDYSYTSDVFAGPGYFLAGDAGCFLDPLLSTGVHLAMYSGMNSAACVASILRDEVSEQEAAQYHEQSYRQAYLRFLVFVSAFYEARGKDGYFSKAGELSRFDADPNDLKRAFLNLVSGLEDIADAEGCTSHLIGEVSRRIVANHELRKDKAALKSAKVEAEESADFFDSIEGLASLSPANAIGGLYVATAPRVGLARVAGMPRGIPERELSAVV